MTPDIQVTPHKAWDDLHYVIINGVKAEETSTYRRHTFRTKEFIVKVDQREYPECEKEIRLWATLNEEDRPHFVPILCSSIDERWVCQELLEIREAHLLGDEVREELWDTIILPLCEKYNLVDLSSGWNWGMVDGVPMIYDYGQ